jgi:pimeloyl-CoA synthetase
LLHRTGYEFRNSGQKGWFFVGEGEEPLDKSIFDYVKQSSSTKKQSSPKVHKHVTSSNKYPIPSSIKFTEDNTSITQSSPAVHQQFTPDEVKMIREMLKSWKQIASTIQASEQSLHDRIKQLPQGNKTRKTIVIDSEIGKRLDEFCESERVNKSDVLHLALVDFLAKFGK